MLNVSVLTAVDSLGCLPFNKGLRGCELFSLKLILKWSSHQCAKNKNIQNEAVQVISVVINIIVNSKTLVMVLSEMVENVHHWFPEQQNL